MSEKFPTVPRGKLTSKPDATGMSSWSLPNGTITMPGKIISHIQQLGYNCRDSNGTQRATVPKHAAKEYSWGERDRWATALDGGFHVLSRLLLEQFLTVATSANTFYTRASFLSSSANTSLLTLCFFWKMTRRFGNDNAQRMAGQPWALSRKYNGSNNPSNNLHRKNTHRLL